MAFDDKKKKLTNTTNTKDAEVVTPKQRRRLDHCRQPTY